MSLDGGNNAVTDELKAQVRELQEMMRVMMEDRRPAFGSDGGYQEAVPPRPAATSSGHMYAPGTLLVSHVRTTVPPKYDGIDKSKYVLWKREFLSYLFEQGCRDAVNYTPCPIRVGSEDAVESELRAIHSPERIEQARRA